MSSKAKRMARGAYEVRRARKEHRCSSYFCCRIAPGDLYFYSAMPPEHELYPGDKWWITKLCLRHAERMGWHNEKTRAQAERLKGGGDIG